jgi:hypothetical protein
MDSSSTQQLVAVKLETEAQQLQPLQPGDHVVALLDAEADDMLHFWYIILFGVHIDTVVVLNDKCAEDGWDRTTHIRNLIDLIPSVVPAYKHSKPAIQLVGFDELTTVPSFLFNTLAAYDPTQPLPHIISIGNALPLFQLADLMTQQEETSITRPRIPVWTYGSVNFRWAAKSLVAQGYEGDPYEWIAAKLNDVNLPLQFHIFETYGAFKEQNTLDRDTAPALYEWIATGTSRLAVFLRSVVLGWNKLMMKQICDKLRLEDDTDLLWQNAIEGNNTGQVVTLLKRLATDHIGSATNTKILTAILTHPCEVVFADIGLAVAAMNHSPCFLGSDIQFSKKGMPYTIATPVSKGPSASTYFVGNPSIWSPCIDAVLQTFKSIE